MKRSVISTDEAPGAIGPYSQAILAGDLFFSAMQIALDPAKGQMVGEDAGGQTRQAMTNLQGVLREAGLTLADAVKVTIFVADIGDFGVINEIYASFFDTDPPARSVVEVARMPKDALVGIDLIACRQGA